MRKILCHFASLAWLNVTALVRVFFFSMIQSDIFKVLSSFCQTDFTVINTSAPSASLFDCLLLYVKRKCQSNFLQAYLHDNERETNRRQLAEITGSTSALLHTPVEIWKWRRCMLASVCLFPRARLPEGGMTWILTTRNARRTLFWFTTQFTYSRVAGFAELNCHLWLRRHQ